MEVFLPDEPGVSQGTGSIVVPLLEIPVLAAVDALGGDIDGLGRVLLKQLITGDALQELEPEEHSHPVAVRHRFEGVAHKLRCQLVGWVRDDVPVEGLLRFQKVHAAGAIASVYKVRGPDIIAVPL